MATGDPSDGEWVSDAIHLCEDIDYRFIIKSTLR